MEETTILHEGIAVEKKDGRHLIFQLGDRGYGIPILQVNEIICLMDIIPVPKTPHYIKGIVNLRGKIIPIMDLRLKFDMPAKDYDEQTSIIIVSITVGNDKKQMGILIDTVSEVVDIPASEIEPPPQYGAKSSEDSLGGVGKVKGKVVMLLNIENIIHSDELIKILDNKKDCTKNTEIEV